MCLMYSKTPIFLSSWTYQKSMMKKTLNSFNWDKALKYFRGLLPKKVKDQDREEIIGDLLELKESMREDKVHPIWINLCMFWQMLFIIASILVSIVQVSIKISR